MKSNLIIIGAGGHGKVVADIALKMNKWENVYFLDDDATQHSILGIKNLGNSSEWTQYIHDHDIFIAIGSNYTRKRMLEQLEEKRASIPVLIHPSAVIGEMVEIDSGSVVMAGAVINSCSKIGKGCIINTSSSIDHDNQIDDFVHLSPGVHLAGTVRIGQGSWLGAGSVVINNVTICDNCTIGAGATVIKDITVSGTYAGVPANKIK